MLGGNFHRARRIVNLFNFSTLSYYLIALILSYRYKSISEYCWTLQNFFLHKSNIFLNYISKSFLFQMAEQYCQLVLIHVDVLYKLIDINSNIFEVI